MSFFEKTSNGPRYGDLISGVPSNGDQKAGGNFGKKGSKTSPIIQITFMDLKLDVDYDVATNNNVT